MLCARNSVTVLVVLCSFAELAAGPFVSRRRIYCVLLQGGLSKGVGSRWVEPPGPRSSVVARRVLYGSSKFHVKHSAPWVVGLRIVPVIGLLMRALQFLIKLVALRRRFVVCCFT